MRERKRYNIAMRLSQEAIQRMISGRSGGGGGGGSFDPSALAGYATQAWTEENYISKTFFNELFVIHKKVTTVVMDGETEISRTVTTNSIFAPNEIPGTTTETDEETGYVTTVTTEISSIESKKGFWTNYFLSALGLNSEGGGGGLTLNEPLATINVSGLANHPSSSGQTIVWNGSAWVYGTAGGGTGTVTGVKVGDITYSPVNGIVSIPEYPTSLAWSAITGKPTTLAGYGITDAKIENGVITLGSNSITPLTASAISDMATKTWVGNNYLPLTGGTLSISSIGGFTIKNTTSNYPLIRFEGNTGGGLGFIGFGKTGSVVAPYYVTADANGGYTDGVSQWNFLLHSGNYTDYTYSKSYIDTELAKKLDVAFFDALFQAYAGSTKVTPNASTSSVDNIKAMFGFWTQQYISALGKNDSGGEIVLNEPLASINDAGLAAHPSSSGQTIVWNGSAWTYGTAGGSGMTYTFATGDANGQFKVTPSSGAAYNVNIKGLAALAYKALLAVSDIPDLSGMYLPLTGGTITGNIGNRSPHDLSATNNGVESGAIWRGYYIYDKDSRLSAQFVNGVYSSGSNFVWMGVRNYNTEGTQIADYGIGLSVDKSGNASYTVSQPAAFRTAIDALSKTEINGYTWWGRALSNGVVNGDITNVGNISFSASGKNIGGLMSFVTAGNGTVGVGTLSPNTNYKLDVNGYTKTSRLYLSDTIYMVVQNDGIHIVGGGLYADTYVSALGLSDSGGSTFDESAMWIALGTNISQKQISSTYLTNALAPYALKTDIPSLKSLSWSYGSVTSASGSSYNGSAAKSLVIPKDTGHLTNNAGFITSAALNSYLPLAGGTMTGNVLHKSNTLQRGVVPGTRTVMYRSWVDKDNKNLGWFEFVSETNGENVIGLYVLSNTTDSADGYGGLKIRKERNNSGNYSTVIDANTGELSSRTLKSTVATGTAPLVVASTTLVGNLNADLLDGQHGSYYAKESYFYADGLAKKAMLPVGYGHDGGQGTTNPYHLLAEATVSGTGARNITAVFLVSSYYSHSRGILFVQGRIDGSGTAINTSYTNAKWLMRETGLDVSKFILTTKATSDSLTCRLYYKVTATWSHARIRLLDDGSWEQPTINWKLYTSNTNTAGNYVFASIPSDETQFESVDSTSSSTATQLATTRNIWGQNFNGTSDVTGNLYMPNNASVMFKDAYGTDRSILTYNQSNNIVIGWDVRSTSNTYITGDTIEITRNGGSNGFYLNTSNNIGLGGVGDSGHKLYVQGATLMKHSGGESLTLDTTATYNCIVYQINTASKWSVGTDSNGTFYWYTQPGGNNTVMSLTSAGILNVGNSVKCTDLWIGNIHITYDSTNGGIHVANGGLSANTYVSALGVGQEGGGSQGLDIEAMWTELSTPNSARQIDGSHISSALSGYATQTWVNQQGFVKSSGVTSVAMSVPSSLRVNTGSGATITTSGTFAITLASGYSIPTTAKQSNWDAAYGWGNHANAGYTKAEDVAGQMQRYSYISNGIIHIGDSSITPLTNHQSVDGTFWGQSWSNHGTVNGDMSSVGNISFSASGKNIGGLLYFDTSTPQLKVNTSSTGSYSHGYSTIYPKLYVNGELGVSGGLWAGFNELYYSTPYIDFHYDYSQADYTTRIIESEAGILSIISPNVAGLLVGGYNGDYVQIGQIRIVYESSNNALRIENANNGGAANLYAMGGISALGMSGNASGEVAGNLVPSTDGAYELGSTTKGWSNLYLSNADDSTLNIYVDTGDAWYSCDGAHQFENPIKVSGTGYFSGKLSVAGTNSNSDKLYVNGSMRSSGISYASSHNNTSDARLKNIIGYEEVDVETIARAPLIKFTWKDGDSRVHIGTTAQYWLGTELHDVIEQNDYLSMDYAATALAGVISVARKVMTHEEEIAALKRRIGELENEIETLKAA